MRTNSDYKNSDIEILLKSDPESIVMVESLIDEFRESNTLSDEIYGNMLVVVTEAVNNAIIHGNLNDSTKNVSVAIHRNDNLITFIISDQGCGFDYTNLPDPTSPENIENTGGRGIFLMKNLSDLVVFSNDGTNVEIHFKV